MGYPDRSAELTVLRRGGLRREVPQAAMQIEEVGSLVAAAAEVTVPPEVEEYLLDLVRATRADARLLRGVSTRGAQALYRAARAHALVKGRGFVVPEDLRELAGPVLGHRVVPRTDSGPGGEGGVRAIEALVDETPAPG